MSYNRQPEAAVERHAAQVSVTEAREPTVYIIDPDEAVRDGLEKLFHWSRLAARSFLSAEEFLEGYDGNEVGCLVLEIDLPGISGLDLQEVLSKQGIDLPVIILSGQACFPSVVRAVRAGAIDFLEKPFQPHTLVRRVREAIRQAQESFGARLDFGVAK